MSLSYFKANPHGIAGEQFGNEIVLINLIKGNYYNITESSAVFIWNILQQYPISLPQLSQALTIQFDVDLTTATQTAEVFLRQLLSEDLIVETAENIEEFTPMIPDKKQPFNAPKLVVFDDMQDLIVLDPVHDVDAQKGWPFKK
ncbi:PqqD family protein [Runella sp.]|uniref:PqqD family protein n=1 Tax=Runella sp. TaxID=1960881 RepID=UPI003D12A666